jgi:hypothetical protein
VSQTRPAPVGSRGGDSRPPTTRHEKRQSFARVELFSSIGADGCGTTCWCGADQKVVNFEQILFANGRILFERNPSGCPFPSLRNKTARKDRMRSITKGWKILGTEIGKKKPETLVFEMELGFWAGATVVMKILDEDGASPEVLAGLRAEVRAYQHEMCDLRDALMRNHYSNEQMFGEK